MSGRGFTREELAELMRHWGRPAVNNSVPLSAGESMDWSKVTIRDLPYELIGETTGHLCGDGSAGDGPPELQPFPTRMAFFSDGFVRKCLPEDYPLDAPFPPEAIDIKYSNGVATFEIWRPIGGPDGVVVGQCAFWSPNETNCALFYRGVDDAPGAQ